MSKNSKNSNQGKSIGKHINESRDVGSNPPPKSGSPGAPGSKKAK